MTTSDRGVTPTPQLIRWARENAGWTQEVAASKIYSTRRTLQDWERGIAEMHPGLWELFRGKAARAARTKNRRLSQ